MFASPPARKFLEMTLVGDKPKKLYMPSDAVLTFEDVPEGKNPAFPQRGTFLRYDYGEGLAFAIVAEQLEQLKEEIGTEGFVQFSMLDGAEFYTKKHLILAIQEKTDEEANIDATQLSLTLGGQVGSIFVTDKFEDIKVKMGA